MGKGAEVHLCGHFEAEGHSAEDEMFYGAEEDEEEDDEDDSPNLKKNHKTTQTLDIMSPT